MENISASFQQGTFPIAVGIGIGTLIGVFAGRMFTKISTTPAQRGFFHIIDLTTNGPVTTTLSLKQFTAQIKTDDLNALRTAEGWKVRNIEQWKRVFDHTIYMTCIVKNGELVGTGSVAGNGRMAMVHDLVVKKAFRHNGYGTLIMNDLIAQVQTNDYYALSLHKDDSGLARFYSRFGFKEDPGLMTCACVELTPFV